MPGRHRAAPTTRRGRGTRAAALLGVTALALASSFLVAGGPAYAAGEASVTVTPATTSTDSGVVTTYTLSYSCSVTGGCNGTTVTFPTTALTGDAATTDFASWVKNATCPNLTVASGAATINLNNIGTGTGTCTFTVQPPEYLTRNNAQATITPTISGTGFSATGAPATLTVTAGHHTSMNEGRSVNGVSTGRTFYLTEDLFCGQNEGDPLIGDIGYTDITITDTLPANFTYTDWANQWGSPPGATGTYDPATHVFTYHDPTGETCNNPQYGYLKNGNRGGNHVQLRISGTASTGGSPDPVGDTICDTSAQATVTYLDDPTPATLNVPASTTNCVTVLAVVQPGFSSKIAYSSGEFNGGQYPPSGLVTGNPTDNPYTYAGNWDGSGNTARFTMLLAQNAATNGGAAFEVKDPMPCLDNRSGDTYSSPSPGAPYCENPAFVPTKVTVDEGFVPTPADAITVVHTDGSTASVPWTTDGWVIPSSPAVAELDFPPFAEEGANTSGNILMTIQGYAASTVPESSVLTNTFLANAFNVGDNTPLVPANTRSSSLLVADPNASAAIVSPTILAGSQGVGTCRENVYLANNGLWNTVEIPSGSSEPIYVDYLAPVGAAITTGASTGFTLQQRQSDNGYYQQRITVGAPVTTGTIAATLTSNYRRTGRTLYEWVIPADTVTHAGMYSITPATASTAWTVTLPPGCAGVQQNDLTVGYDAPVKGCLPYTGANAGASWPAIKPVPTLPSANPDLNSNGVPSGNFCGASFPLAVAPVNPGFSVDKTVQGNLDNATISGGGVGNVSPSGGTATYGLTFTNSGQSNLTDPVMYDLLPRVGDTQATSSQTRGSDFAVALTGVGPLPAGVTVAYSAATNPCRPEVLATNPGCTDDWTTTVPADLSTVKALKISYSGTVFVDPTSGTHSFTVPFTVSTPDTAPGKIAWNTVGTNAYAGNLIGAAESSRTGLQAEVGPAITKAADRTTYAKSGDSISYTYTVTNNTAVALTDVGVIDNLTDAAAGDTVPVITCLSLTGPTGSCSGASTDLAPGQSATFTATYAVTQGDLDHGKITDTATVTATPPTGGALTNTSDAVTVNAVQAPVLALVKSADPSTVVKAGDQVTYRFEVTNTGNVTVHGIDIDEKSFTGTGTRSAVSCPGSTLAPTGSEICTATYPVTQADIDAGQVTNTATATGTAPDGTAVVSPISSATVTAAPAAALTLVKSAEPSGGAVYQAGQKITYHYLVTNSGAVTVTGVAIEEGTFTGSGPLSPVTCEATPLAPDAQLGCTATYTLTQADVDAGTLTNTATATGTTAGGAPVTSAPSTVTTPATPNPVLTVSKSVTPTVVSTVGETVTYTFQVSNTGNVTIHGVGVAESTFTGSGSLSNVSCPDTTLIPGQDETCSATYSVTQADLDAGSVSNTAHATGTAPSGSGVTSNDSSASVAAAQTGGLTLVKTADPSSPAAYQAGQEITYHYLVTNTGNVTVTGLSIDEVTFTGTGTPPNPSCPTTSLAAAVQVDCTATYVLTQADVDAAVLTNTAMASGTTPNGTTTSPPSTVSTPQTAAPSLTLTKSASPATVSNAGDQVSYSFLVQNTGNVTIGNIAIQESDFSGTGTLSDISCPDASLVPGQRETCIATYAVTQGDLDAGSITNTAAATGTAPGGAAVTSPSSTAVVPASWSAALTLTKSTSPASVNKAGDQVTYSFLVTNTGNVTVDNIAITDSDFSGTGSLSDIACPGAALAPDQDEACTATYTVTQDDIDAGSITNTATAGGTDPTDAAVTSAASAATVAVTARPALTLVKSASRKTVTAIGQHMTYSFLITNTGNVTVQNVAVTEKSFTGSGTLSAITCPSDRLAPAADETCTATYTVTDKDVGTSALTNTAVAHGTLGTGNGAPTATSDPSTAKVTVQPVTAPSTTTTPNPSHTGSTPNPTPTHPAGAGGAGAGGAGGGSTATTGSDALMFLGVAAALLLSGALLLITGRRRRAGHAA